MLLVIPDIHENWQQLDRILKKFANIKKLSLGDWFDTFGVPEPERVDETARHLKEFISDPNNVALFGNHDMPYAFPDIPNLMCSGHQEWKYAYLKRYLKRSDWNKMKIHHWHTTNGKKWLLSHAGFHPRLITHPVTGITEEYIDTLCQNALQMLQSQGMHYLVSSGQSRGGDQFVGGVTWMDWSEFEPIGGINQIVGHTRREFKPRENHSQTSENYCIDNGLNHVALIDDDGKVEVIALNF